MATDPIFLYVEDDPLSRQVMDTLVTSISGFSNLSMFDDSANFMARLEALPAKPTVILLDIHMQPDDGFTLLKMIRRHPDYASTTVVAVTASVMNEEVIMLQKAGFDGAIGKPIDLAFFPEFINRVLQGEKLWHIT